MGLNRINAGSDERCNTFFIWDIMPFCAQDLI